MANITKPEKDVADSERRPRGSLSDKSIWEDIDEIMSDVPEAALNRLPADGAERHDHYLHDTHRKAQREA